MKTTELVIKSMNALSGRIARPDAKVIGNQNNEPDFEKLDEPLVDEEVEMQRQQADTESGEAVPGIALATGNMGVKKAIQLHGDEAISSILNEFSIFLRRKR